MKPFNATACMRRRPASGLTLVEVLAVVVILGMIAGVLVIGFSGSFGKARQELARTGIASVAAKVEIYYAEYGRWPSAQEGLAVLSEGRAAPTAPYFIGRDQLTDPWGNPFLYVVPGPDGHPYEIVSLGADNRPGGTGEDADISSRKLRGDRP